MSDRYVQVCDVCGKEGAQDAVYGCGRDEKGNLLALCPEHYQRCNG